MKPFTALASEIERDFHDRGHLYAFLLYCIPKYSLIELSKKKTTTTCL